jgi:hypothetical protein
MLAKHDGAKARREKMGLFTCPQPKPLPTMAPLGSFQLVLAGSSKSHRRAAPKNAVTWRTF